MSRDADFLTNLVAFTILGVILWAITSTWSAIQRRFGKAPIQHQNEAKAEVVAVAAPTAPNKTSAGPIRKFGRWLRSSDGLIIFGIGFFVAGLMGFEPSQLWTEFYPQLTQSYESVGVAVLGAMLATAGVLKRLPHGE